MKVKIKKLTANAQEPKYATDGSGCFDLFSSADCLLPIHSNVTVGTSLAFEIPEGYVMLLFSRSGDGFHLGVRLANCVGVIDSDYRGEVKVKLKSDNLGKEIRKGDKVAQGMILPVQQVAFDCVEELTDTARGEGGFGSTGS